MANPGNLREIQREIVSALVLSADDQILMGKKDPTKGGVYVDCWHIPGGGLDDGEEKLPGLKREVREETNLDISDAEVELLDDHGHGESEKTLADGERVWCLMHFNVYKVRLTKPAAEIPLTPSDDLVELAWFKLEELDSVKLTPPSIELFTRLGYLSPRQ